MLFLTNSFPKVSRKSGHSRPFEGFFELGLIETVWPEGFCGQHVVAFCMSHAAHRSFRPQDVHDLLWTVDLRSIAAAPHARKLRTPTNRRPLHLLRDDP